MICRVHVVGGASGIGLWVIKHILNNYSEVYCYDINVKALEKLPASVTSCNMEIQPDSFLPFASNFKENDIVLIAVPDGAYNGVVNDLALRIKPNSLVVTLASVQGDSVRKLKDYLPNGVEAFGCHPMFGPTVPSPIGQVVVFTAFDESNAKHQSLSTMFSDKGITVSALSPEEHDRLAAYVQSLVHFVLFGFAATLGSQGAKPKDLFKMKTPNFELLFALAGRVLKLTSSTTGKIQTTPEACAIREKFVASIVDLNNQFKLAVVSEDPTANAAKVVKAIREPLERAEIDLGAAVAGLAVGTLSAFEAQLFDYKKSGRPLVFKHRASGRLRIVRVLDIRSDVVVVEEAAIELKGSEQGSYAVNFSETARQNYLLHGIVFPKPATSMVEKRNVQITPVESKPDGWRSIARGISCNISVKNSFSVGPSFITRWLPKLVEGLWGCEILQTDEGLFRLKLLIDPREVVLAVAESVRTVVEERVLQGPID
jgi:prephenate dehydrogenase